MAEIMEPPTRQPAHQNQHKAVRSSGKNTRPVAEGPGPPKPHSPDRPRRRRGRFSSSLQGRPAYPAPTLYLPTPTLPGKLIFYRRQPHILPTARLCIALSSQGCHLPPMPPQSTLSAYPAPTLRHYRVGQVQPTLHRYRVSHVQPTLHRYPAPTLHRRQNRRASSPAPRPPGTPPRPAPSLPPSPETRQTQRLLTTIPDLPTLHLTPHHPPYRPPAVPGGPSPPPDARWPLFVSFCMANGRKRLTSSLNTQPKSNQLTLYLPYTRPHTTLSTGTRFSPSQTGLPCTSSRTRESGKRTPSLSLTLANPQRIPVSRDLYWGNRGEGRLTLSRS